MFIDAIVKRRSCVIGLGWTAFLCMGCTVDFLEVVDTIDTTATGNVLRYMATSADCERLYVVQRTGSGSMTSANLLVIDSVTGAILHVVDLGIGVGFDVALHKRASGGMPNREDTAYVAISEDAGGIDTDGPNRVAVVDLLQSPPGVTSIPTSGTSDLGPTGLALVPGSPSRLFVTLRGDSLIEAINVDTNMSMGTFESGGTTPVGIAANPAGDRIYAAHRANNPPRLTAFDITAPMMLPTLDASINLPSLDPSNETTSVAVRADGTEIYVTSSSDSDVAVVNAAAEMEVAAISTGMGNQLREVTADFVSKLVYTVSSNTNEMSIIDVSDPSSPTYRTEIGEVPVSNDPFDVQLPRFVSTDDGVDVIGLIDMDAPPGMPAIPPGIVTAFAPVYLQCSPKVIGTPGMPTYEDEPTP